MSINVNIEVVPKFSFNYEINIIFYNEYRQEVIDRLPLNHLMNLDGWEVGTPLNENDFKLKFLSFKVLKT